MKTVKKGRITLHNEKSDEELKLLGIKKYYPDIDVTDKDQSYIEGMFEAICSQQEVRNDSLLSTRKALEHQPSPQAAYEKWLEHTAKM